ncbi:MAG: vanadium-dependent haloperoxidase [Deltaproteobacteria bacterium]|nr:vanadium-dependent haloperoxidase [Deltaproteobacteria bacterium]
MSPPAHPDNGDEALYPNKIATYSKGLPHNALGEVDLTAYKAMVRALSAAAPSDFELIPMGCADPSRQRRLVNPQGGLAFELEGADPHELAIPPAPAFASAAQAGEIVENYWMALLRDVPFLEYGTHSLAQEAAADLDLLSDFAGPKIGGHVTADTLFRGLTPGDLNGPYLSQFFWLPAPYGANRVEQKLQTTAAGLDYLTSFAAWLEVQNGWEPLEADQFEAAPRYIINGRDMGQWVHIDVLFQAYFISFLCMVKMGVPPNPGNPYLYSATQEGFGTFGGPYFATLLSEVATRALKAQWFQKWFVHRRARPEAFAGRVHLTATGGAGDPIHADVFDSSVLPLIAGHNVALNGSETTYLLPQAYPEGSPLHPSYGAGHATVAGACVTILKALFDESFEIPDPVVPNADGSALVPYSGPPLTIGGELNKIASNVAIGRNFAGIHWRSDATESLKLGEAVALNILRDQRACYNEAFNGFTFTKFDGTTVTV